MLMITKYRFIMIYRNAGWEQGQWPCSITDLETYCSDPMPSCLWTDSLDFHSSLIKPWFFLTAVEKFPRNTALENMESRGDVRKQ